MAILYRLETNGANTKARVGAYHRESDDESLASIAIPHYDPDVHPLPYNDAGLADTWKMLCEHCIEEYYLFGFPSLNHYRNWFLDQNGREVIIDRGVIGVYYVPDAAYVSGQFQAIANKDHMQHLGDMPTNTLADIHPFSMEYL